MLEALETDRDRDKKQAAKAEAEDAQRERNCHNARRQVALYQRANGIFGRGPDGDKDLSQR